MCDRMLQDSLRCYRDPGPGRGVGRGFGLAECGEARVCGGAGRGLAGWDGDTCTIADPLQGRRRVDAAAFLQCFRQMGSRAVVVH